MCPLINIYYGKKLITKALINNALIDSWGLNEYWMNYIIKEYNIGIKNYIFPEGNNYILNRNTANFVFDNRFGIYYQLNTIDSFDFNWVKLYYGLDELKINDADIYNYYSENKLFGNNLELNLGHGGLSDGMIEHTFERIIISVCMHLNQKVFILKDHFFDCNNTTDILKDRLIRFFEIKHLKNLFQMI